MESPRDKAKASWGDAQKIRSDIVEKLSNRGTTETTSRFEDLEKTMAEFRLACMNVVANDFEYAVGKQVEYHLWQAHVNLNVEYRKIMSRLLAQNQVVVRRKLEKQYRGFLKIAQSFYRVYIQQLSGRFYIPELHQAAYGTDIELPEIPAPDSKPPSQLRAMILKSCQITLVHLGDLVRYRCQMSEKLSNQNFDKAIAYYSLAHTINPDDGSAHHQLAVLYQLQGRHFDIVYHFHRSICVTKPSELGVNNLGREFKGLENSHGGRKGPKDPCETMITWFLRLHAFFFQGEPFSQQAELEEEVLHRIEISLKSDIDETILRKMIFINIAAYDIALDKVKSAWTIQGSQSAQFLLRFNIRTVLILLRILKAGLLDESATSATPESERGDHENAESPICFSQLLMKLFPLFRIYISWIYVSRADAKSYREFLEPYISDVYRLLADTLTFLNATIDQATITTSSKYLLLEDTEALGLKPLSDRNLPLFSQVEGVPDLDSDPNPSKKHKTRKPRQRVFGRQYKPHTEAIWRMRDIVYCGLLLAGSSTFPLTMSLKKLEGREVECWDFITEPSQAASIDEISMLRVLNKLKLSDSAVKPKEPVQKAPDATLEGIAMAHTELEISPVPHDMSRKGKSIEEKVPNSLDIDLSGDSEMVNMVNKLLDPLDDDSRPQSSQTQGDTSYGMNTATANEVFGRFATDSAQPSPASKAIPSLPWGYFYEPTPKHSSSQSNSQLASDGEYVPRSAHSQLEGFDSSPYLSNLTISKAQAYRDVREQPARESPRLSQGAPRFDNHRSKSSRDSLETSRSAVLDSLTSALYAQNGLNPQTAQDSYTGRIGTSPYLGSQRPSAANSPYLSKLGMNQGSSHMERSASQQAAASNLQSPPGSAGFGLPSVSPSGFKKIPGPFENISSPFSNEGGFLAPGSNMQANGRSAPGPPQQYSPWPLEPARSGSAFSFSHPSSLFGGTPAAPQDGLSNTVFSNGHYYNASTPFGRLGPGHNNKDDPTRYRNQIKSYLGEEDPSYEYDQKALQSAWLGNDEMHRQK
ncbi:uncharacterized protein GGS22DRAFT_156787 [Annulohypoxylon maeteangense]|uniref:uncharacterized protein n=1 Tax=Annulohypoxylon maeteangense TaxID=1927788 RepID=UPI002008B283|nr:uncharacterized protein GGS22DRAFT_156787 [Annulohypoxylon maeteangense]KAI0887332.1 hypothetical protein GGS22DRAFT_156787 [Annulohypoxylon maeteangense]